jgi:hypothetical protein
VDINDNDLDVKIAEYTKDHPRRGQRDVTSRLEQDNIHVTRQRIRDAMHRVDPEGCEQRRLNSLHRRTYSVPGPHYLWHCDGNHKLKPFKLVVLGFMDGFSRNVTGLPPLFCSCSLNLLPSTDILVRFVAIMVERTMAWRV